MIDAPGFPCPDSGLLPAVFFHSRPLDCSMVNSRRIIRSPRGTGDSAALPHRFLYRRNHLKAVSSIGPNDSTGQQSSAAAAPSATGYASPNG